MISFIGPSKSERIAPTQGQRVFLETLLEAGFERADAGQVYTPIDEKFLAWIGLNRGTHPGYLRINPFIGFHIVPIESRRQEWFGMRYKQGRLATLAFPLGVIAPEVPEFIFVREAKARKEAKRLAKVLHKRALPWLRERANLSWVIEELRQRERSLGGVPEALALALALDDEFEAAIEYLNDRQSEYEIKDPEIAMKFADIRVRLIEQHA